MVLMLRSLKWRTELRNFNSQVKSKQTDRETENESGYLSSNPFATPTELLKTFVCVKQVWKVSSWLGWNECLDLRRLCCWSLVVASGTPDPCDWILWIWTMNWWKNWWATTRQKAFVRLILSVCLIVFLFLYRTILQRESAVEYHVNVSEPEETEEELDFQDLRYPNHVFLYQKSIPNTRC